MKGGEEEIGQRKSQKDITEETCTYEEAKEAVDKLREIYFNRKAGNFLKKVDIQEIASMAP